MRLSTRVALGYLALVALMAVLALHQLTVVERLHAENRRLAGVDLEVSRAGLRLRGDTETLERLSRILFVRHDEGYAERLQRVRRTAEDELTTLRGLPLSPGERRALTALTRTWNDYADLARSVEAGVLAGTVDGRGELLAALAGVEEDIGRLEEVSRHTAEERVDASARAAERAHAAARVTTALALAGGLLLAFLVARSVARPLRRLGRGTRALARGEFAHRVPPGGGPELAALARDFNAMADRLGELDRLKRDFVATVSHDLKAPLASMQETTRLLLEGVPGELGEDQERLLRLNLASGERLGAMIGDLLEVARLEAGAVEFELEPHDLSEVARSALEEVEGQRQARGLDVALSAPQAPVRVAADRPLLLRAVRNLLTNAVKFSPQGGRVRVTVRTFETRAEMEAVLERVPADCTPPRAGLTVEDQGTGVPDADKERVFDRFHRVDPERRGVQGTGLGLAIARGVVDGHGGHLWVEDAEGGGSRFALLLPRAGTGSGERNEQDESDEPGRAGRRGRGVDMDTAPPRPGMEAPAAAIAVGRAAGRRRLPPLAARRLAAAPLAALLLAGALASGCATAPVLRPRAVTAGDRLLAEGRPEAAARAYERQLEAGDRAAWSDVALFRLALLHLTPESPVHDPAEGEALLRRLIEAQPESPHAAQARWILSLHRDNRSRAAEIGRLRRQLEELRRIDLDEPPG